MGNILDDEFMIQMDDSPPFNWIIQSSSRFMSCGLGRKVDSLVVSARGNSFSIAEMARDVLGSGKLRVEQSFSLSGVNTNCVISYSGELKEAIMAVKGATDTGIVISSGGLIKNIARNKGWDYIPLPKGYPTRFLFPEIFGCLLSLLGTKVEFSGLENFIDHNSPSEITSINEAKRLALATLSVNTTIIYDEHSEGLAKRYGTIFKANSGVGIDLKRKADPELKGVGKSGKGLVISLVEGNESGSRIGKFPYECSNVDGYVKNELIGELASLYLGALRANEIELLEMGLE